MSSRKPSTQNNSFSGEPSLKDYEIQFIEDEVDNSMYSFPKRHWYKHLIPLTTKSSPR
jgi:hypothetical protein